jgi:hypothetical protein
MEQILTRFECREGTTGRALPNGVATAGGSAAFTVALCLAACKTAGYVLAGVEYSNECCKSYILTPTYSSSHFEKLNLIYRVWQHNCEWGGPCSRWTSRM